MQKWCCLFSLNMFISTAISINISFSMETLSNRQNGWMFSFTAPFNTLFVTLAGCRVVAGVGGVLILISVLSSAFSTQFWHLLITYSILGGKWKILDYLHTLVFHFKTLGWKSHQSSAIIEFLSEYLFTAWIHRCLGINRQYALFTRHPDINLWHFMPPRKLFR